MITHLLLIAFLAQSNPLADSKCTLEGQVVSATTGAPLKKATVTLEGAKDLAVNTSADGKFKFENLDPGDYTVKAERVGYLEGADMPLKLAPEGKNDLVLKLTPQAILAGRVLDEDGDPVLGARVAYIRWVAAGSKKFKLEEDTVDVNGEGGFTITNLEPGSYYLEAIPDRLPNKPAPGDTFALTFYPNSTDLTGAATLPLAAGGEMRNLEIRMRRAQKFHVRGKVAMPQGATGVPRDLDLISQDSFESYGSGQAVRVEKGTFEFSDVTPGSYILRSSPSVQTGSFDEGTMSITAPRYFLREPIEVTDRDIDDLNVSFSPAVDLNGLFRAPGITFSKPPSVSLTWNLYPGPRQLKALPDETGAFRIPQIAPDRFEIIISDLPRDAYVKSTRYGSQELNGTLDLTSGAEGTLEITLAPNAAEISGVLHDATGMPVPYHVVHLWAAEDDPTVSEQTASDGSFTFKNLAPGEYHLVSWDDVVGNQQTLPGFRKLFDAQSIAVTVHEGSRETADLKLIKLN